jgi:hypothetical protein
MTYQSVSDMQASMSLRQRCIAAAANEGSLSPDIWVAENFWQIVAHDDEWDARWSDSVFNYNLTFNPDTGARPDVITDQMITTVVQALMAAPPGV